MSGGSADFPALSHRAKSRSHDLCAASQMGLSPLPTDVRGGEPVD